MISCVSAGTGNEGQFAPIRLSCVESFFGGVSEVVDPSMAAEKFSARRVRFSLRLLQEWRGVLL